MNYPEALNIDLNLHYVYGHFTVDTNELFYIGVGKGRRAWQKTTRNAIWKSIYNKHGVRIEILMHGFKDRNDAVKAELKLQEAHTPRACIRYGDSMNSITADSTREKMSKRSRGRKFSEEHKRKLAESKMGDKNPMKNRTGDKSPTFGSKRTEESRRKMSESQKKHFRNNPHPNKGKPLSEEAKKNLSEKAKGRKISQETREKISKAHKGKKISEEELKNRSLRMSGKGNPMYGKSVSEETKRKISEKLSGINSYRYGISYCNWPKATTGNKAVINCRGEIFRSIIEAARNFGLRSENGIINNIKGRSKSAGKYSDGTKATWNYYTGSQV